MRIISGIFLAEMITAESGRPRWHRKISLEKLPNPGDPLNYATIRVLSLSFHAIP